MLGNGQEKNKKANTGKKQKLPAWLLAEEGKADGQKTGFPLRKGSKNSGMALERTLKAVLSFLEDALFNEKTASRSGLLQKVEPRTKIVVIALLLIGLSFERSLAGMSRFIALGLVLAALSRIPAGMYLKRLLPGVLFTAVIALPASLGAVTPGQPVFTILTHHSIYISRQGLLAALGLVARVTGSMMIVLLAGFTTRPPELVKAVSFFIPGFLKTVFSMSYRYMFFLVRRLEEFILARKARGAYHPGKGGTGKGRGWAGRSGPDRKWVGSRAASLLIMSLKLRRELEFAMEARGAAEEVREPGLPAFRFGLYDAALVLLAAGAAFI